MIRIPIIRSLLTADMTIDEYMPLYRKLILLNSMLILSSATLLFFTFYNLFISHYLTVATLDLIASLSSLYALFYVRKTKRIERGAIIGTANLFIFMTALTMTHQGADFSLIWTIFLPVFSILVLGRETGFKITLLFYLINLTLAYQGIGVWQDGSWNLGSFMRFAIASFVLVYVIYSFEYSFETAHMKLQEVRVKEAEQMRIMKEISLTDPLTALYNRRHLDTMFHRNVQVARLHEHYFGLFVLDLDYFKQYNDLYGHLKGDRVLQAVAEVMRKNLRRESDVAFRLGGEEFSGLIVAETTEKIMNLVDKIRREIEALDILHEGNPPFNIVTASFGVCMTDISQDGHFDTLYKIADDALYRAKEKGRNRIVGCLMERGKTSCTPYELAEATP